MLPNLHISVIIACLYAYKTFRRRAYITSAAIPPVSRSPWAHLFNSKDDKSFVSLTGLNVETFMELHEVLFSNFHIDRSGRKEKLGSFGKLGCILLFLNSTLQPKHLCLIFGIFSSSVSRIINFMLKLIVKKMMNHNKSRILWPDELQKREYALQIKNREPLVTNAIGFIDGLALRVCCSSDIQEQNAYYNGWHGDTYVNNFLAFLPKGKVIFASINYFGSWHDAKVCRSLYEDILSNEKDFALIANSAFPRSKEFKYCIHKPIKPKKLSINPVIRDYQKQKSNAITSLRQAAEWGMRSLQATFATLKLRLPSDKILRYNFILSCLLLHNFRTHNMGINEISQVFDGEYEQYIRDSNYDRNARYFNLHHCI